MGKKDMKSKGIRIVRFLLFCSLVFGLCDCARKIPRHFTHEVLNRMTPVKDQGDSQTCWIYAIETEHLSWGDSVNLSPYYIQKMMEQEPLAPKSQRGEAATLLRLIEKYGIVGYDAMRTAETPAPRYVFMLGAEYTPQEFARSVCAPGEYLPLMCDDDKPYDRMAVLDTPDNWLHDLYLNVPIDTLLVRTERAVRRHHGVCWCNKSHAMAIVGIAHDDEGEKYFIMKNSWGTDRPYKGLEYVSFRDFRKQTVTIVMPTKAFRLL